MRLPTSLLSAALASLVISLAACGGGDAGSGGPDGGGSGAACGGFAGLTCGATEYCDYGANTCGAADEQGTCQARPTSCNDIYQPVCGCDGVVHGNACDAASAGSDVSDWEGSCTAPLDTFACGHRFCAAGTEYCQVFGSDIGGEPSGYECLGFPTSCGGSPDCACLADVTCGDECTGEGTDLTVTCPGG